VAALGARVRRLVVPEMNLGQIANIARQHARCDVVAVTQVNGRVIEPETIAQAVRLAR
jgi:hypothetical protein